MTRYVAFLRAVNVAGHARAKMSDVRDVFVAAGGMNVGTYIQSGNVVFECVAKDSRSLIGEAKRKLGETLGEEPEIMLRTAKRVVDLVDNSPFEGRPTSALVKHYVVFLSRRPRRTIEFPLISEVEALHAVGMSGREIFVISRRKKNGFFGFPNNFIEQELGVAATTRNWSTITKLAERHAC
jgi:uncharacterized protein (DUF1697 family)